MNPKVLSVLTRLSNEELLARVKDLAAREREATVSLIAHLAELDQRRLYLAEGYLHAESPAPLFLTSTSHQARPAVVVPLAPERYKVQFTASAETYEKLRLAQNLLRHEVPNGDPAAIFDRALTALLQDLAKRKLAATDRPRAGRGYVSDSRHIPAEVKRAVWLRDGGRCALVGRRGVRCSEQGFLEFHHVKPYAAGGQPTVDNIQLRCRAHNGHEAELDFGPRNQGVVREKGSSYSRMGSSTRAYYRRCLFKNSMIRR